MVPAEMAHVHELLSDIRQSDKSELQAMSKRPVGLSLSLAIRTGEAQAAVMDGKTVALFGAPKLSLLNNTSTPWLIGTNAMERSPTLLGVVSRTIVERWKQRFDVMFNYVDARNTVAITWLKWLGFGIHEAAPYGHNGMMFHRFEWRRG